MGEQHVGVEAGALARVDTPRPLVDPHEQGVAVAVEPDLLDPLDVAGGVALDPVLLAGRLQYVARPVVNVRARASSSIQPSISTSPVSCCWATAGPARRPIA
jgi:hypothetical protein